MSKQVTFKNDVGQKLVGSLWQADSDTLVIMTHGSCSNRLARGIFPTVAQRLNEQGYAVLAFDFRGHGQSDDAIMRLQDSADDLEAALDYAKDLGFKHFILIGHSLGAYACLMNYTQEIRTMIFLGAMAGPVEWYWQGLCTPEQLEGLQKRGYVTAEVNDEYRKAVTLHEKFLDDIRAIDQEALIAKVACPIYFIHGDADQYELDLLPVSQKALEYASQDSELKVLPGVNHIFENVHEDIAGLVADWCKGYSS